MKKKYYKYLKEGDKVRVKKHLKVGKKYNNLHFVLPMEKLCGKKVTIKHINKEELLVGVTESPYFFTYKMLRNPKKHKCVPSFAEVLFGSNHSSEEIPDGYVHTWTYEKPPKEVQQEVQQEVPSPITETKSGYRYYTKLRDKINEIITYLEDKK